MRSSIYCMNIVGYKCDSLETSDFLVGVINF